MQYKGQLHKIIIKFVLYCNLIKSNVPSENSIAKINTTSMKDSSICNLYIITLYSTA